MDELSAPELADRLAASFLPSNAARELFVALLRELARGRPVPAAALAAALGWPVEQVREALGQVSSVEQDDAGRVVGAGLTLRETPHVFDVDGRRLYTWCALDSLMFPALLEKTARVSSRCARSGVPIHLTVTPEAVLDVEPAKAVVSLVLPEASCDVRSAFCAHSNFFASMAAAEPWLGDHPGATVGRVEDVFRIGRELARRQIAADRPRNVIGMHRLEDHNV